MSDPYHTAVHEAGHVVMAHQLGVTVQSASIVRGEETLGHTFTELDGHSLETRVQVWLAGYAACRAANIPASGFSTDFNRAKDELRIAGKDPSSVFEWSDRVVEVMCEPRNLKAVAEVAAELQRCGELQRDQLEACIARA